MKFIASKVAVCCCWYQDLGTQRAYPTYLTFLFLSPCRLLSTLSTLGSHRAHFVTKKVYPIPKKKEEKNKKQERLLLTTSS